MDPPGGKAGFFHNRRVRDATILFLVLAVSFGVRAWALYRRDALDGETSYYILGHNLFSGNGYTLNGLPNAAFAPLYPILTGMIDLFTSNARTATSLVSLFTGFLLPLPV
ncbi:MAG: hypothetical protein V1918_06290, partial [Planctomycetota bacterium]